MTLPSRRGLRIISQPRPPHRRRLCSPLAFAWVLPALLFLALLQAGSPPDSVQTAPQSAKKVDQKAALIKLKKQADKAAKELSSATAKYESNKSKHRLAQARLERTRIQAARANQVYEKWRKHIARFADAIYRSPLPDSNTVLLTAKDSEVAVNQATTLDVVTKGEEHAIAKASKEKKRADALNRRASNLEKATAAEQSELAGQIASLKKKSKDSTKALMKLLARMNGGAASRDASRAVLDASCGKSSGANFRQGQFSNGLMPDWALCNLPGYKNERLRADAARAFVDLNVEYAQKFGKRMCITDSYRNLAEQQSVYSRKPGMAAVPGKSNHGYALALDLGCGINQFQSPQFNWMKQNAPRFGWVHPAWAESSPFEPWHWEYQPGTGTKAAD